MPKWKSGRNETFAEVLQFGGEYIIPSVHELNTLDWRDVAMHKSWKYVIILPLYKERGPDQCVINTEVLL